MLQGQKAEQEGGKWVNISIWEFSDNEAFQEKALSAQHLLNQVKSISSGCYHCGCVMSGPVTWFIAEMDSVTEPNVKSSEYLK